MFSQKLQVAVADLVLSAVDRRGEVIGSKAPQTLKDLEAKSKEFRYQDAESQVRIFLNFHTKGQFLKLTFCCELTLTHDVI